MSTKKEKKIPKTWENVRKIVLAEKRQQEYVYRIIKALFFIVFIILGVLAVTFMFNSLALGAPPNILTSSVYVYSFVSIMTLLIGFSVFIYPRIYLLEQLELFTVHRDFSALITILKKRLSDTFIELFLVSYVLVLEYIGITIIRGYVSGMTYTNLYNTILEITVTTHILLIIFGLFLFVFNKIWSYKLIITQINRYLNIVHWDGGSIKITDTTTYPEV